MLLWTYCPASHIYCLKSTPTLLCFETEKNSKEYFSSKIGKVSILRILLGNMFLECKYLRDTSNMKSRNEGIPTRFRIIRLK